MTHPYRGTAEALPADESRRDPEALAVYLVLGVLGAVRVAVAVTLGEEIGPESTVALAMVIAAALGLMTSRR